MLPLPDWVSKPKSSMIRDEQVEARQTRIAMLQSNTVWVLPCLASYELEWSKAR